MVFRKRVVDMLCLEVLGVDVAVISSDEVASESVGRESQAKVAHDWSQALSIFGQARFSQRSCTL